MKLGLICGMEAEAKALGALRKHGHLSVGISAAKPERATELAEAMVHDGVDALLSWGIAGALAPDMASGTLIIPETVIDQDGSALELSGLRPRGAEQPMVLSGSDTIVATLDAKSALFAATGAAAVDMETHRIARVARLHGVPAIAIRAVSDPSDRALPPGTESALNDAGNPRILPVLAGLMRHPSRLPALLDAKRDLDRALETLRALGTGLIEELLEH